ncbi:MAG: DUF3883 domain-containing protein, partial [Bacillota bacterium]
LLRLFEKLDRIREQMGSDRVFDVIGDVFAGRTLKELIVEAVTNQRSLEDVLGDIEREPDEEMLRRVRAATQEMLATRFVDLKAVLGEMEKARENRLVPEYIEQFFRRAAKRLNVTVESRAGGYLRAKVPFEVRNLSREFRARFGEVMPEYSRFSFDKEKAFRGQAEFVAMGHPLFEAVVERISQTYGHCLRNGAVFEDPAGRMSGLIWLLEGEVRDGSGEVVGRRLFAVYQDDAGAVREVSPSVFWDLRSARSDVPDIPEDLLGRQDEVLAAVLAGTLARYREELLASRQRDAAIKEKYGVRSLEALILQSEEKLADYETRRAKGENIPEATLINERRRREELEERKKRLLEGIRAETALALSPPRVLGVAAVLCPEEVPDVLREDPGIEQVGMEVCMEYERAQGRCPEDVSVANAGYDIRSVDQDGNVRYIEVKARAKTGRVALTPNEWMTAQKLGEKYWLYVLTNAASRPELYLIENPAACLRPDEEVEIVRYVIRNWQAQARRAE